MLFLDKLVYHISYCTVAWNLGSLSGNVHALCWVRSFLSGPCTGGRIRYYPTDREPNSETVRIPRSPRIKRYRAFWSSSRWWLFCPSPWFPRRGSSASPPRRFGGSLLRHSVEARRRLLLGDSEARCSAIAWCQQVPSYAALSFPDSSSVFLGHLCLWFSRSTIWLHLWCICGSISWRMSLLAFASPGRALSRRGWVCLCRRFSGSRRATGRKQGGVGMMSGEVDEGWFALI